MDDLHFLKPIRVGMIVELRAQVNATFRTSMEAGVRIESEDPLTGERAHVCSAYLTFVAQDQQGRPVEVTPLVLKDEEDRRREQDARRRRSVRLGARPREARAAAGRDPGARLKAFALALLLPSLALAAPRGSGKARGASTRKPAKPSPKKLAPEENPKLGGAARAFFKARVRFEAPGDRPRSRRGK